MENNKLLSNLKIEAVAFFFLIALSSYAQDSLNASLKGHLSYAQDLNDVWGYVDSAGNEYALVGTRTGFSVVDVTTPSNPQEMIFISGASSTWRDIKTFGKYAYVTHDNYSGSSDGLLIVDLDSAAQGIASFDRFYGPWIDGTDTIDFLKAHNLYIDENGYCYIFGDPFATGALILDLNQDPTEPELVGIFDNFYLHDGYVRGDTLWGAAVYQGALAAIDVSQKSSPTVMGTKGTPGSFTHNCWPSDDNQTVFTTDEVLGGWVAAYDVTDLGNMSGLDRIRTSFGSDYTPHNVLVHGNFLVTAHYRAGLHITDATHPDILMEAGYYDTSPLEDGGFDGAWGAYPYLPSGYVLVSDIEEGLFIIDVDYTQASYLRGSVEDGNNGSPLFFSKVYSTHFDDTLEADLDGKFRRGEFYDGPDTIVVSYNGYQSDTSFVQWQSGQTIQLDVKLFPPMSAGIDDIAELRLYPNPTGDYFRLEWDENEEAMAVMEVYDLSGRLMTELKVKRGERIARPGDMNAGMYLYRIKTGGKLSGFRKWSLR